MPAPCPTTRPKATIAEVEQLIQPLQKHANFKSTDKVACVIVRGYYRDSMGKKGRNNIGMYDDAIFWLAGDHFSAWNGNADPSRFGWNPGADGYMAQLQQGVWRFVRRRHKGQYPAFGQGENPVQIGRMRADGTLAKRVKGCFGINLHRGGVNGTSSEGCLTVPVAQWTDFCDTGYALCRRHNVTGSFPLFLTEVAEITK